MRTLLRLLVVTGVFLSSSPLVGGSDVPLRSQNVPVRAVQHERVKIPHPGPYPLLASQESLKAEVMDTFKDVPEMAAVILCESSYQQFDSTGSPLMSPTHDVGVMSINIPSWGKEARSRGLDIYNSAADNIAMGRIIYEIQGIHAWACAK